MRWIARGFSLTELVIALAIVALVAVLAVPAYQDYMMSVRRTDAVTTLLSIHAMQERWRTSHPDYATLSELGWQGSRSMDGYYRLELMDANTEGFRLTATPVPRGAQEADACGVFVITQAGPRYGGGFAGRRCWRR